MPVRFLVGLFRITDARRKSTHLNLRPQQRPRDREQRRELEQVQKRWMLVHQMPQEETAEAPRGVHPFAHSHASCGTTLSRRNFIQSVSQALQKFSLEESFSNKITGLGK